MMFFNQVLNFGDFEDVWFRDFKTESCPKTPLIFMNWLSFKWNDMRNMFSVIL